MIIPLIFTLDPVYENLSQTWVFYKAVSFCKKYGWSVIAQEQYFKEWEKQNRIFPQFFQQDLCDMFEYDVPKKADLFQIQQISIPKDIEQEFIRKHKTQSDAYVASFREDWKEMEDFLCNVLQKVMEDSEEKIEAITCLTYVKFLDNISKRMDIPVIYYEWGPFRYSSYRNTAFFDINGEYKNVHFMFETFLQKNGFEGIPVLKNNEILALLLKEDYLKYVTENHALSEHYDEYEMGIIGGYNSLVETSAYTYLNMVELYNNALKIFSESEVAVRYHPGDPIHARLNVPNEKTGELIDFILSCKRVACISSNVEVEAMLYGKQVYDTGIFKYQGIVNDNMLQLEDRKVTLEEINFIVFVSIIPYELLNSVEYLRFRLAQPDLKEVYLYHLKYYLECFQISYEQLLKDEDDRLTLILKNRKNVGSIKEDLEWMAEDAANERKLYITLGRYRNAVERLRTELVETRGIKEELAGKLQMSQEELNRNLQISREEKEKLERQLEEKEQIWREQTEHERAQYRKEKEQYQAEMGQLKQENEQLQRKYEAVMNSKTMRMTKPLRDIWGRKKANGE